MPLDTFTDDPRQVALQFATNPILGNPSWSDDSRPLEGRVQNFLDVHQQAGSPWADTASHLRQTFPGLDTEHLRRQLDQDRLRREAEADMARRPNLAAGETEDFAGHWAHFRRHAIPFWSSLVQPVITSIAVNAANKKVEAGTATREDFQTLLEYQRGQDLDRREWAATGLASAVGTLGELAAAQVPIGSVLPAGYGGAVSGALGLAPRAGASGLATAGRFAGRAAVTTALTPSFYGPEAGQRAIENRSPIYYPENLGPAVLQGYGQALAFEALPPISGIRRLGLSGPGILPAAGRLGVGTLQGMGTQQIYDAAAFGFSKLFLPKTLQLRTDYGILDELLNGHEGEALQHATVQALTFAAFGVLHEAGRHKAASEYAKTLDELHGLGVGRDEAGQRVEHAIGIFDAELATKTKAELMELFKDREGPEWNFVREEVKKLPRDHQAATFPQPQGAEPAALWPGSHPEPPQTAPVPQGGPEPSPAPQTTPAGQPARPGVPASEPPQRPGTPEAPKPTAGLHTESDTVSYSGLKVQDRLEGMRRRQAGLIVKTPEQPAEPVGKTLASTANLLEVATAGSPEEARSAIDEIVSRHNLTPKERKLLEDRTINGKTLEEIARPEGVSRAAIKKREVKLLAKLRTEKSLAKMSAEATVNDLLERMQAGESADDLASELSRTSGSAQAGSKAAKLHDWMESLRQQVLQRIEEMAIADDQHGKLTSEKEKQYAERLEKVGDGSHGSILAEAKRLGITHSEPGKAAPSAIPKTAGRAGPEQPAGQPPGQRPEATGAGPPAAQPGIETPPAFHNELRAALASGNKYILEKFRQAMVQGAGTELPGRFSEAEADQAIAAARADQSPAQPSVADWSGMPTGPKVGEARGHPAQMRAGSMVHDFASWIHDVFENHQEAGIAEPPGVENQPEQVDPLNPHILFHGGKPGPGGEPQVPAEKVGPKLVAQIGRELDVKQYTEGKLSKRGEEAYADLKQDVAVLGKMAAGDPRIKLEEAVHLVAERTGFDPDPINLSPAVAKGYQQFAPKVPAQQPQFNPPHTPPLTPRTMAEGLAEVVVRRTLGTLDAAKLTAEQKAAVVHAEEWIKATKGLGESLDRIGKSFVGLLGKSATEQVGGMVNRAGKPAGPEMARGERIHDFLNRTFEDQYTKKLDDLYPFVAMEKEALQRTGLKMPEGTSPSEVWRQMRYRALPWVAEMETKGVIGYDGQGKEVILSKPLAEILGQPADPSWLGKLSTYLHAVQAFAMEQRQKGFLSGAQHRQMEAALREMVQDKPFMQWAEPAAQGITRLFDATVQSMEMAGLFKPGTGARWADANPFYVPSKRVFDAGKGEPLGVGPRRGEEAPSPGFAKKRTGSGEELMSIQDLVRDRLEYTAYILAHQTKMNSLYDFAEKMNREGSPMGDYLLFGPMKLSELGKEKFAQLKNTLRYEDAAIWKMIEDMGDAAKDYFTPESWPKDGTRASIVFMRNGEPVRARVGNQGLYELLTGTQGSHDTVTKIANAVKPALGWVAGVQRFGFTSASWLYHLRNWAPWRDPGTYVSRSVASHGTGLGDLAGVYRFMGESVGYYGARLFGKEPAGEWAAKFKVYDELAGRQLTSQANLGGGMLQGAVNGWRGLARKVLDVVGAGEKGVHVKEMMNLFEKAGYTQERLARELAQDPKGANPIPMPLQIAALNAAAEVSHNFNQMGYQVRAWNQAWPFLGTHIASAVKDLGTFRDRPLVAMRGLALLASAKLLNWALNKDDPEYKELSPYWRDGFVFRTPLGLVGFPGPRGIQTPILGLMDETLRAASDTNPKFGSLVMRSLEHVAPSGGPSGVMTAAELLANRRGLTGPPIVPHYQQEHGESASNWAQYRLPYAAGQLSGGLLETRHYNPLAMVLGPQHQSVNDLYDRLGGLDVDRRAATRQGLRFPQEGEYQRLHQAQQQITRLNHELQGMRQTGRGLVQADRPPAERQEAIRRQILQLAQRVVGHAP